MCLWTRKHQRAAAVEGPFDWAQGRSAQGQMAESLPLMADS